MTSPLFPPDTMTIQATADFLNVSREYLIKEILDKSLLPFHLSDGERKLYREDVILYLKHREAEIEDIMAKLASLSQELGL